VLGRISEKFREAVKALAEQEGVPVYQFRHKERKDDIANSFRRRRNGRLQFDRDKTVYVNHYYFYIDDEEFGPLFLKICSYAPWSVKLCLNGHEWAKRQLDKRQELRSKAILQRRTRMPDRRDFPQPQ
jgi:hypothetical protein